MLLTDLHDFCIDVTVAAYLFTKLVRIIDNKLCFIIYHFYETQNTLEENCHHAGWTYLWTKNNWASLVLSAPNTHPWVKARQNIRSHYSWIFILQDKEPNWIFDAGWWCKIKCIVMYVDSMLVDGVSLKWYLTTTQ